METIIGFERTHVESGCGRIVSCSYLEHPAFDRSKNLWQSLHYIFIQYSPNVAHSSVYLLRSAYNSLLDYVSGYNENTQSALHITQYIDLSTEVFNAYVSYLRKNKKPISYAEKLRSAMTIVTQNTGKLPIMLLPSVKSKKDAPTEPLTDAAYEELCEALKIHISALKAKLAFREKVAVAEPYQYREILDEIFPPRDKGHVFQWFQYALKRGLKLKPINYITKFRATQDPALHALINRPHMIQEFKELYELEAGPYLMEKPVNPFQIAGTGMSYWTPDNLRTMKTLIVEGYPFSKSIADLEAGYTRQKLYDLGSCCDATQLLIHKHTTGARLTGNTPFWDDLLGMYYPTPMDMAAIVIFIMMQSGWNKEVVLAIDSENFEHALTGAIKESMRVVFSEKNKSQGLAKPYEDPKQITANSDKDNPYSIYNLIILAGQLSAPLKGIPFDSEMVLKKGEEMNDLFLCIRAWGDWQGPGGKHTSITNPKAYQTAVKAFFETYPVYEDGRRLAVASDVGRRLRPTWAKFQRKTNPLSLLSLQMGHANEETTDVHYDSSGQAVQERRVRLRSVLEEVMHLLRTRQFQGLLGEQASVIANAKPRVFHIPGKERALWGCRNQRKPSWPGAEKQIPTGMMCTAIDKCLGCDQVWITEDSLPYLFERLQHLEEELYDRDAASYSARLESEKQVIEYLIDTWDDEDVIKVAERYQRKNSPLLPRDLASLRLIFQEESVDE